MGGDRADIGRVGPTVDVLPSTETGNPIDDIVHPQLKEKNENDRANSYGEIAEKSLPKLFDSENDTLKPNHHCSSDDNSFVGKGSECNSGEKNDDHATTVGVIRPRTIITTPQVQQLILDQEINSSQCAAVAHTNLQIEMCISSKQTADRITYPDGICGAGLFHLRAHVNVWGLQMVTAILKKETSLTTKK